MRKPLNGTKTHPLTDAAKTALKLLTRRALPAQEFNPGIVDRLTRGDLAEIVQMPSPYKTRSGNIAFLRITEAGRRELPCESCGGKGRILDTTYDRTGADMECGKCFGTGKSQHAIRQTFAC